MSYPYCLKKNARIGTENLPVSTRYLWIFAGGECCPGSWCAPLTGLDRLSGDHSL